MDPGTLLVAYLIAIMLIPLCITAYTLSYLIEEREQDDMMRWSHKVMRVCVKLAVPYFIVVSSLFFGASDIPKKMGEPEQESATAELTTDELADKYSDEPASEPLSEKLNSDCKGRDITKMSDQELIDCL